MQRFFVCRAYLKYKGTLYTKGELLPITFNHHDKARSIYGSRIGVCEVDEAAVDETVKAPSPITTPLSGDPGTEKDDIVPESASTDEVPEVAAEAASDAIEVTETSIVDEVPETVPSSADEAPKFSFSLPTTGTPT